MYFVSPSPPFSTEESFYTNNKRSSVTLSGLTEQDATSKRVCRGSIGVCLVKILRGWAGWALPCLSRQHWFRCLHMRSWSLIGSDWLAKALCYDIHHRHPQGRILSSPWNAITTCFTSSRRRLVGCLAAFRRFNRVLAWKGTRESYRLTSATGAVVLSCFNVCGGGCFSLLTWGYIVQQSMSTVVRSISLAKPHSKLSAGIYRNARTHTHLYTLSKNVFIPSPLPVCVFCGIRLAVDERSGF